MRLVRRVSVIKLGERSDTVLVDVLIEALDKIFGPLPEGRSYHPEAQVYEIVQR